MRSLGQLKAYFIGEGHAHWKPRCVVEKTDKMLRYSRSSSGDNNNILSEISSKLNQEEAQPNVDVSLEENKDKDEQLLERLQGFRSYHQEKEQVCLQEKQVFWYYGSYGALLKKRFQFQHNVLDACIARFQTPHRGLIEDDTKGMNPGPMNATKYEDVFLCVLVHSELLCIYSVHGHTYQVPLPFLANKLFVNSIGILIERTREINGTSSCGLIHEAEKRMDSNDAVDKSNLFSLLHPLDDVKPVTSVKPDQALNDFLIDEEESILFVDMEFQMVVSYHVEKQKYSVWSLQLQDAQQHLQEISILEPKKRPVGSTRVDELHVSTNYSFLDATNITTETDTEHIEHPIIPDFRISRLWTSTVRRLTSSSLKDKEHGVSVFVTYDMDSLPLLAVHSKDLATLFLHSIHTGVKENAILQVREAYQVSCKLVAPVKVLDCGRPHLLDILVMSMENELILYRGDQALCKWEIPELVCPNKHKQEDYAPFEFGLSPVMPPPPMTLPRTPSAISSMSITPSSSLMLSPLDSSNISTQENYLSSLSFKTPNRRRSRQKLEKIPREGTRIVDLIGNSTDVVYFVQEDGTTMAYSFDMAPHDALLADILNGLDAVLPSGLAFSIREHVFITSAQTNASSSIWDTYVELLHLSIGATWGSSRNELDPWKNLLLSSFHHGYKFKEPFIDKCLIKSRDANSPIPQPFAFSQDNYSALHQNIQSFIVEIFEVMHLLYEDKKLNVLSHDQLVRLVKCLSSLAAFLSLDQYMDYYARDFEINMLQFEETFCANRYTLNHVPFKDFQKIPDIMTWLIEKTNHAASGVNHPFPLMKSNHKHGALPRDVNVIEPGSPGRFTKLVCCLYNIWLDPTSGDGTVKSMKERATNVVCYMVQQGISASFLDLLPFGVATPLREAIDQCRAHPSYNLSREGYQLIGREDLARLKLLSASISMGISSSTLLGEKRTTDSFHPHPSHGHHHYNKPTKVRAHLEDADGLHHVQEVSALRFGRDRRVKEVCRMLRSSRPVFLKLDGTRPEVSDSDMAQAQQARLLLLCKRSMALPTGRGMLTLNTLYPNLNEVLAMPPLQLSGRSPRPFTATLAFDTSGYSADLTHWPEFHNGAASGLRLQANVGVQLPRTWIVYNRPMEPNHSHAGLLMALGLLGYLSTLAMTDIFDYLSQGHEATTVGILLGMAAAKRGSMDRAVSKMLCLHVPSLLPHPFTDVTVAPLAQTAAIIGMGLLYQGSCHRLTTEFLLTEMGRRPTSERSGSSSGGGSGSGGGGSSTFDGRESYALSVGWALGVVVLGCGGTGADSGLTDLYLEDRLHTFMVGGRRRRYDRMDDAKEGGAFDVPDSNGCSRIHEGEFVNIDLTASGATLALGLIYLKSNNHAVAARLAVPDTLFLLDFVRPDVLMLRVLSRGLILWDGVQPSQEWVFGQVPVAVQKVISASKLSMSDASGSFVDSQSVTQAFQAQSSIIAGACFVIGLRYAGTACKAAASVLTFFVTHFRNIRNGEQIKNNVGVDRLLVDTSLGVCAQSLGLVMAGTGDLATLRLLRELRMKIDSEVTYGSHMALSMAIGLLFLAGGSASIKNTNEAIAALIISLYPHYPLNTSDNRYHLQALRHLYVLATDHRLLQAVDVDTGAPCFMPVQIRVGHEDLKLVAPCLLPDIHSITHLHTNSPRYYPIILDRAESPLLLTTVQKGRILYVKRKSGHLPYKHDPQGIKSLLARAFPKEGERTHENIPAFVRSFTDDPYILSFCNYFCTSSEGKSKQQQNLANFCIGVLYECLTSDKPEMIAQYVVLYQSLLHLHVNATTLPLANICFLNKYYYQIHGRSNDPNVSFDADQKCLIQREFFYSVQNRVENDLLNAVTVDGEAHSRNFLRKALQSYYHEGSFRAWLKQLVEQKDDGNLSILGRSALIMKFLKYFDFPYASAYREKWVASQPLKNVNETSGLISFRDLPFVDKSMVAALTRVAVFFEDDESESVHS